MAQVGVVLEQVRGATVPPQVAGDVFFHPQLARVFSQHPFQAVPSDGQPGPVGDEQLVGLVALQQFGPDGFDVVFQVLTGDAAQRDTPGLCRPCLC